MARRQKAKPKRKSPKGIKGSDEKQSARFIEAAREFGADESGKRFNIAVGKLLKSGKRR